MMPAQSNSRPDGGSGKGHPHSCHSHPSLSGQLPLCHFSSLLKHFWGKLGEGAGG